MDRGTKNRLARSEARKAKRKAKANPVFGNPNYQKRLEALWAKTQASGWAKN